MKSEPFIYRVAARADLKGALKDIYKTWPNLLDMTMRLGEFMGDRIPSSDKRTPLLQSCISNAVERYRNVPPQHFGNEFQMVAFIRGLIENVPDMAKVSVVSADGEQELWEPFTEPLSSFVERFGGNVEVEDQPQTLASPDSLRLMVLSRIISTRDLQWIDETVSLDNVVKAAA
jgi:hypothetical protein